MRILYYDEIGNLVTAAVSVAYVDSQRNPGTDQLIFDLVSSADADSSLVRVLTEDKPETFESAVRSLFTNGFFDLTSYTVYEKFDAMDFVASYDVEVQ